MDTPNQRALRDKVAGDLERVSRCIAEIVELQNESASQLMKGNALGGLLHQTYTGLESIFEKCLRIKQIDLPQESQQYHRAVLKLAKEAGFYQNEHADILEELLGFRHVIRHGYGMDIRSDEVFEKCSAISDAWPALRKHIELTLGINTPR